MDICICITDSLCCIAATKTTLQSNCTLKKRHVEALELKNITKIKNSVGGLDTAEERVCELKDRPV